MDKKLEKLFHYMIDRHEDISCIDLSTEDGFTITCVKEEKINIENEKLSAVTTSLAALSNSASVQLINAELIRTVIETKNGDLFIFKTNYLTNDVVLSVIAKKDSNHAKVRYFTNDLADKIKRVIA